MFSAIIPIDDSGYEFSEQWLPQKILMITIVMILVPKLTMGEFYDDDYDDDDVDNDYDDDDVDNDNDDDYDYDDDVVDNNDDDNDNDDDDDDDNEDFHDNYNKIL